MTLTQEQQTAIEYAYKRRVVQSIAAEMTRLLATDDTTRLTVIYAKAVANLAPKKG